MTVPLRLPVISLAPANTKMDSIAALLAATKMDAPYVTYLRLSLRVFANKNKRYH